MKLGVADIEGNMRNISNETEKSFTKYFSIEDAAESVNSIAQPSSTPLQYCQYRNPT